MPGIEGGGNAKAMPSGLPASCFCKLLWMYSSCSSLLLRTSHGLRFTKKNPAFVLCTCVRSEKLVTAITPSMPGVLSSALVIFCCAASVRCAEAPSGSCNARNIYPWSSVGMNPPGRLLPRYTAITATTHESEHGEA